MSAKMSPSAVLVIQNGVTKLVNIKQQDAVTKVLDMVRIREQVCWRKAGRGFGKGHGKARRSLLRPVRRQKKDRKNRTNNRCGSSCTGYRMRKEQ